MLMKKSAALILCLLLAFPALAFAGDAVEITLWISYPIGSWGNAGVVDHIIAGFNAVHPGIRVNALFPDPNDDQTAVWETGDPPDVILSSVENLAAIQSATGRLLDISDLWDNAVKADIIAASPAVEAACRDAGGAYREYPLCMTAHCMVINYNDFEAAGALRYIDEETHTWTTLGFISALDALYAAGYQPAAAVYCGGQGGDQGTRALVTNLYSGRFTDAGHTVYTMDSEENIQALELLARLVDEGKLDADPDIMSGDEIAMFCNSTLSMGFCWNASTAVSNRGSLAEDVRVFPMAFPSDDGVPELQGGIWGFGLIDNGNATKAAAAKNFVKYVCDNNSQAADSVFASGYFPTRASLGDIYAGTDLAAYSEYGVFMPYLGDYYQVTANWNAQRAEWWKLLKRVFAGGDIASEVAVYCASVNP